MSESITLDTLRAAQVAADEVMLVGPAPADTSALPSSWDPAARTYLGALKGCGVFRFPLDYMWERLENDLGDAFHARGTEFTAHVVEMRATASVVYVQGPHCSAQQTKYGTRMLQRERPSTPSAHRPNGRRRHRGWDRAGAKGRGRVLSVGQHHEGLLASDPRPGDGKFRELLRIMGRTRKIKCFAQSVEDPTSLDRALIKHEPGSSIVNSGGTRRTVGHSL